MPKPWALPPRLFLSASLTPPRPPPRHTVGEGPVAAPVASSRNHVTASGISGGIFGEATAQTAQAKPLNNMTKSSVEGGVFHTANAYAQPDTYPEPPRSARGPKPEIDINRVAGQGTAKSEEFSLFAGSAAPLAEVTSFRSNPNKPSQDGGIFGAPPPMTKPGISRSNPNASSIAGGIFG